MINKTIGAWQSNFHGYEAIIIIRSVDSKYFAETYFFNSNSAPKKEELIKNGNRYFIKDNEHNEYFLINKAGLLEIYSNGLLCTAMNISPGVEIKELPPLTIANTIGYDYRYVSGMYSKSSAKILEGTNNEFLIVHYEDINTTFKVDKSTNKILSFVTGFIPADATKLFSYYHSLN